MTSRTCLTALILLTVSSTFAAIGEDVDANALKVKYLIPFEHSFTVTCLVIGLMAVFLSVLVGFCNL